MDLYDLRTGQRSGAIWDQWEFEDLSGGVWMTCDYTTPAQKNARDPEILKRLVFAVHGQVVQHGSPGTKAQDEVVDRPLGIRVAGLEGTPEKSEPIAVNKTATLAGVQLGWSEAELRAFAEREGYRWQVGDFTDYLVENWGMSISRNGSKWLPRGEIDELHFIRYAAYAGPRVTLMRGDQRVEVIFHPETKVVREVLIRREGAEAVAALRQEVLRDYSPAGALYGGGYDPLDILWSDRNSFVVLEFFHHASTGEGDPEGGFVRLADQDF
jgi:hypothetical protein